MKIHFSSHFSPKPNLYVFLFVFTVLFIHPTNEVSDDIVVLCFFLADSFCRLNGALHLQCFFLLLLITFYIHINVLEKEMDYLHKMEIEIWFKLINNTKQRKKKQCAS